MSKIFVEDNIPMPPLTEVRTGRRPKYPWYEMEIGHSFRVPEGVTPHSMRCTARGLKTDRKFVIDQDEDGVWRCWRTA